MSIMVKNISYSYPGEKPIFEDISFNVQQGEVFCIMGPNGTGKSTLLNCVACLFQLHKGEMVISGKPVSEMTCNEIAQNISYVPQFHQAVFPYSVEEFVMMGRAPHIGTFAMPKKKDREIAAQALKQLDISYLAKKKYTEISGGERQMAMFARAICQESKVILLDEPTSHLDFGNQIRTLQVLERLAAQGYAVILTSHFPDHALLFSHKVAIFKGGRFIDIGPAEEVITETNMRSIYGIDVKIPKVDAVGRKVCLPVS
jgi:iron complex transport system ATP-binding protein